jgi:FixJ family two-component response regulator
MQPASATAQPKIKRRPRMLIVDDESALVDLIHEVAEGLNCTVSVANTVAAAKKLLVGGSFELMLTDVNLPDGDGLSLLSTLRRHQPTASAIVITGDPSVAGAIRAIRGGAVDFLPKPFDNNHLVERLRRALDHQSGLARQEKRLNRLRDAVKRLGVARQMVAKKVDLLCNDLVSAYGELSHQLDSIRSQESFRKQIDQAKDLEQMLCHTMDWLLRQMGHSNIALWLAGDDGEFQLGAYMKYTIPGEDPVASAMQTGLLPSTVRDGFLHVPGESLRGRLKDEEYAILSGQDFLSISCTYLGEPLAAMIFFRDASSGFTINDETMLKSIAPVFATALATIVRDPTAGEEGESPFADDEDGPPRENRRGEDWWKRGEPPPF